MIDDHTIQIWPVEKGQESAVKQAALLDDHSVFTPTDLVFKNDEIVGALEINSSALVFWWMHRDKTNIRDAVDAHNFYENIVRRLGHRFVVVPCPKGSPYYKLLSNPKSGYVELPETVLFMKQLRK